MADLWSTKDYDWLHPKEDPLSIHEISLSNIIHESKEVRMRDALFGLADLAYRLEHGQFMVVQRHDETKSENGRLFTVKIYLEPDTDDA